jgi:flagellar hook assembly protein FlgD
VFNTNGQLIEIIFNGQQDAGHHKITWDASQNSAGIYFFKLRAGNFSKMIKMTFLK